MVGEFETVLVTGGAGFIGSHFVEAALRKGHRVKILDNLSSGRLEHLSSCKGEGRIDFLKGDILHSVASIEKTERFLRYRPRKAFEEGLREITQIFF